ncbi:uncharacterized protein [Venturia canescens]|uniref:uncharacterized protein n=1 Tax=Venturia canescens TaxID=32260 RepID=UPI001C9D22DA|nr:uncharacterized protein LOC122405929 [Venturia canescens]XP_043266944.1 uncharacterized protein LOC122405929 [Venturia canescens]XP_043266945.1 uncharacterized protein LOC122405929 [Venturia canescens]XP_043266946.1 uncharacterized protein LOC122405929 [Venturia canescens]
MESMSNTTNKTEQEGDLNSLTMSDINDDIIDVLGFDFSDNDTWLQPPSLGAADSSPSNIDSWLKSNIEQDCNNPHDSKKSIDTRTFTRPKKRSGRLSFDFVTEPIPSQSGNVWNRSTQSPMKEDDENAESTGPEKGSIPHMLRPSIPGISGLSSTPPGHESLEAFLNMSQSKGIDSFIDLAEPEFSDDLMDVSQPSLLYSSVNSGVTDDLSQTTNQSLTLNETQASKNPGIEDSQILTESMMQMSIFGDVMDVNFNDTFAKNTANITVLENEDYCTSGDTTFLATTETNRDLELVGSFNTATFNRGKLQLMDATYTPSSLNKTLTNDPHASYIVSRSPCRTPDLPTSLMNDSSYIVTPEIIDSKNYIAEIDIAKDASFIITSTNTNPSENTTFSLVSPKPGNQNDTFNVKMFDTTFQKTPVSSATKWRNNAPSEILSSVDEFTVSEPFKKPTSEKIDRKTDSASVVTLSQGESHEDLGSTFCKPAPKVHSKLSAPRSLSKLFQTQNIAQQNETVNMDPFNATFDKPPVSTFKASTIDSASKPPSSMKKANELYEPPMSAQIEEQQTSESLNRGKSLENLDTTITKPSPKLHSKMNAPRSLSKFGTVPNTMQQNNTLNVHQLDSTFQKTTMPSPKTLSIRSGLKSPSKENVANDTFKAPSPRAQVRSYLKHEHVDSTSHGGSLDNLDKNFHKPATQKLNPPRQLSRLPQSFQKSNPNLGSSSLKYTATTTSARSTISSFGFNRETARPSTARNVDNLQFTSKLLVLGKMKSGSEQRLDVTRNVSDLKISGTGGSTESIDSTQSAHSAPDFDDRLSVRSDSSNTSNSMRSMNIEEFQKIVRLREQSIKTESTPRPGRKVMENNWVAAPNDLPSPILKNGRETYGSRGSSPRSTDSTVKTSSPLLSPTESLQNLPIDVVESSKSNVERDKLTIPQNKSVIPNKISQASIKPPLRNTGEHRTGLRPPSSWTSANRPASGIPRPASRIPGPRFVRPNTKINQGDTKK